MDTAFYDVSTEYIEKEGKFIATVRYANHKQGVLILDDVALAEEGDYNIIFNTASLYNVKKKVLKKLNSCDIIIFRGTVSGSTYYSKENNECEDDEVIKSLESIKDVIVVEGRYNG